ncbi:MAG: hypothetical protein M3Y31_04195, partial [Gemmatimonadota bacterium]|nr:hypothetical protein [Gemmatimonadota bacterium]
GTGQIILFTGSRARASMDGLIAQFGHQSEKRHAVPELGGGAFIIYPPVENEYQDVVGLLVTSVGAHTIGLTVAVKDGQPAESTRPALLAVAGTVIPRLQ